MKKVKVIFPDGSTAEIDESELQSALSAGAKQASSTPVAKSTSMVFPDGSIADVSESDVAGAAKAGAVKKNNGSNGVAVESNGIVEQSAPIISQSPLPEKSKVTTAFDLPFTKTPVVTTTDGIQFPVTEIATPDLVSTKNTPQAIQELQGRVASKTVTPQDLEALSRSSGKSVETINAYIQGGQLLGGSVENIENVNKTKTQLTEYIKNYNTVYGTTHNPDEILSSSQKSNDFLQNINVNVPKSQNDRANRLKYITENPNAIKTEIVDGEIKNVGTSSERNELLLGLTDPTTIFNQYNNAKKALLDNSISKIVDEHLKAGVSPNETVVQIAKMTDPIGFNKSREAQVSPMTQSNLNPVVALGKLFRNNTAQDELLNYQKGVAELSYNAALKQNAINKISEGVVTGDSIMVTDGQHELGRVDENVMDRYPVLQKQEMVRRVNEVIAQESGVVEGSEAETLAGLNEKIYGASAADRARVMKQLGYFDNPKTKDIAYSLLENQSLFADNSMFGSVEKNFWQPFKDLGLSVADIAGIRNNKDLYSDKVRDELFQADFSQNTGDAPKLKKSIGVMRTVANTTANLAGMLAVSTLTEGVATGAGASASVGQKLGAYTSFGLPSFDASLKDSKNFLDSEPAQYIYAGINAIANAEGGRLLDLGKVTRIPGVSQDFAKIAKGFSEKNITESATREVLDGAKQKYIDFVMKYGKNVTKGAATMAYFTTANNIIKYGFGDPNTRGEDILPQAGHAFLDGVLGMSIMGGFGAVADMRAEKNTSYKGTIYNMAINHDAAKDVFDIGLKNGTYDKEAYDSKIQILNQAVAAKNAVDATEHETGIQLSQEQKAVYVANKTAENIFREKAANAKTPEQKTKYEGQADKLAEQSVATLDGLKFTTTLEPLYDLYNAEKEYNQAQENYKPEDLASSDALEAAKKKYDVLYSDYLKDVPTKLSEPIEGLDAEGVPIVEPSTVKSEEVKPNWNYEGEGDAFASNPEMRDGKSAYVGRILGTEYYRAKQKGEFDTTSPITYKGDNETMEAIDGNGNVIGKIKLEQKGGVSGVEHIVVAPEFSRKGVATELIKQIEAKGAKIDFAKSKKISPDAAVLFNKIRKSENKPSTVKSEAVADNEILPTFERVKQSIATKSEMVDKEWQTKIDALNEKIDGEGGINKQIEDAENVGNTSRVDNLKSQRQDIYRELSSLAKKQYKSNNDFAEKSLLETEGVIKRVNNAENINEAEIKKAEDELYVALETAPEAAHLIEPLILKLQDYEFTTKTETSTVTEERATEVPRPITERKPVSKSLDQWEGNRATITDPATGKTTEGIIRVENGKYSLHNENGEKVASLGEKALTDRDISLPSREEVPIPIEVDDNGNVKSITLQLNKADLERGGTSPSQLVKVNFKDSEKALDYAIQLRAEEIGEVPQQKFDTVYEQVQREVQKEVLVNEKAPIIEETVTEVKETPQAEKVTEVTPVTEVADVVKESDAGKDAEPPTGEPVVVEKELSDNDATVLSFKGLQEIADEFGTTDAISRDRKSDVQLMSDAKETITRWVKEGTYTKNVEQLVKNAESSLPLSDEQRIIVQQHMANIRSYANKAEKDFGIDSKQYDDALVELKRVTRAGLLTRQAAGATLRIGDKTASLVRYDLPDMMAAKMEALNVNKLTEEQKADIQAKSKDIETKLKTAEEKIAAYEQEIAGYKAQAELDKQAKKAIFKPKTKKTHDDFVLQRQSLKEKLKEQKAAHEKWLTDNGIQKSGFSNLVLTPEMAKTIGKIISSHVEEVGAKLAEVTKRTLDDVKDLFDGVTESDVKDIIAGRYNEPQKTKSQLQLDLKAIQDEAKLIGKLESLERGEVPKTEKAKIARNQQIKELSDQIKSHDITKLDAIKKRNQEAEKRIQEKISKGDFSAPTTTRSDFLSREEMRKKFPVQYKEAMDAIIAKENAQHTYEAELLTDAYSKRSLGEKYLYDPIKDTIGTIKALRTGIDFSAIMIQNIVPILSHPVNNYKNVIASFRDFKSAKEFNRGLADLHSSKHWELIQKSELDVTEPKSVEEKNKEEIFNRNMLEKDIVIKGKRYNIGKYLTAPFERAFTSLGNHIRVDAFLRLAEKYEKDGHTFESNPKLFKDAAKLLNTQTGRGTLPEFIQRSSQTVNTVIWSPRLMASRLNLLGLGDIANPIFAKRKGFYASLEPTLRRRAGLDMAKFVGMVGAIYATASYFLGAEADLDPLSVTFGDIKDPDSPKSYNMLGGFSQYIKLAGIMAMGERHLSGKKEDVSDAKGKSKADLGLKFLRGKVTPTTAVAIDILDKKDYLGNPINMKDELLSLVTPLSLSNIPKDLNRDGVGETFINGLISMVGINVKDQRDYKRKK